MNTLETVVNLRKFLLSITDHLTLEQLNHIPAGCSNNIAWNLGHLVATQQGICYKRAGIDMHVEERFFETYRSGSKPDRPFTAEDIAEIRSLFLSTIDQLEADLKTDIFAGYTPWSTRYNVSMNNVDDAVTFLLFHEGYHMGMISVLSKLV